MNIFLFSALAFAVFLGVTLWVLGRPKPKPVTMTVVTNTRCPVGDRTRQDKLARMRTLLAERGIELTPEQMCGRVDEVTRFYSVFAPQLGVADKTRDELLDILLQNEEVQRE